MSDEAEFGPPWQVRDRGLAVGIDIGGTKVLGGVVDVDGSVLATCRKETPGTDVAAVEDTLAAVVDDLIDSREIIALGVGAAGWIDSQGSTVMFSPHLAWRNEPLRQSLQNRLGRPVLVENDANAAAWAESRFGAGREESRTLCLTLGTGIGGGVVLDGRIERGRYGAAGEFGHMVIVPDGHRCECGNRGCLEQYASGNALGREARELARADSPMMDDIMRRVDGDVDAIRGYTVSAAALAGDPGARNLFAEVGCWLGLGLANLAAAYDPGMFVIGGGVSATGDLLLEPARQSFGRNLTGRGYRPAAEIMHAALGPDAGLIGAADLARHTAEENPVG